MSNTAYPKYRWYVFAVCLVITIGNGMVMISPSPIIQPIFQSLGVNVGVVTASAILTYALGGAIGGVIGGITTDKFGLPLTYIGAAVFCVVGLVMVFFCNGSIPMLLVGRLIGGIGGGTPNAILAKMTAVWFPQKQRPIVIGLVGAGLMLGITIGLNVAPQILGATGSWEAACSLIGVLMPIGLVLAFIQLAGPKPPVIEGSSDHADHAVASHLFAQALKKPVFYACIFGIWFYSWNMNVYNDLTPGNLAADMPLGLGYGPAVAGQVMSMYSIAMLIGAVLSGFVLLRVFRGNARLGTIISYLFLAVFCGSVLLPFVNQNLTVMMVCLFIAGLFGGFIIPMVQSFVALSFPQEIQGRVGGIAMGLGFTGGSVGLAFSSVFLSMTHSYALSIISCVVVAVVGAFVCLLLVAPKFKVMKDQEDAPAAIPVGDAEEARA